MSRLQNFLNQHIDELEDLCGYLNNYDFVMDDDGNFVMKTKDRYTTKFSILIDGRINYESFKEFAEDLANEVKYLKEETEDLTDTILEYVSEDY